MLITMSATIPRRIALINIVPPYVDKKLIEIHLPCDTLLKGGD
jgi:hypothetical protein